MLSSKYNFQGGYMERRVNVRGVVVDNDGRVFGVKHKMSDGNEAEYWATFGGGLDPNESLHDGLIRESVEELGIIPKIGKLLFMQQFIAFHRDGRQTEKLEMFFHVENTDDYKNNVDLETATHGHELSRVGFVDSKVFFLPNFFQDIVVKEYIDNDKPVLFVNNLNEKSQ